MLKLATATMASIVSILSIGDIAGANILHSNRKPNSNLSAQHIRSADAPASEIKAMRLFLNRIFEFKNRVGTVTESRKDSNENEFSAFEVHGLKLLSYEKNHQSSLYKNMDRAELELDSTERFYILGRFNSSLSWQLKEKKRTLQKLQFFGEKGNWTIKSPGFTGF